MKTSTLQSRRKSWLASCISFVFIIGLFILISSKANDSQIYPSLKQVFQQIGYIFTHQYEGLSFIYTFLRVLFVLILAIISSLLISYLYYLKQWTYGFFQPILVIMKSIPVVALAVYMFLLVGSKRGPYFIAYLVALPIMLEGFILGIDSIPQPIQMELALTEVPKWKKFIQIYLPMMPRFWAYCNSVILSSKPPRCKHFLPILPVGWQVKCIRKSYKGEPSEIVPRSKKAAAQKVQRLCGVSPHSQRSAMIHHIPGRLIRPSRCSNTISMVFSFQTVRFSRTAPSVKKEAA